MPGYMPQDANCPLCWQPLNGEKYFHMECAKREEVSADERADEDGDE